MSIFKKITLNLVLLLLANFAMANVDARFDLVRAKYNVSKVKMLAKDLGILNLQVTLQCIQDSSKIEVEVTSLGNQINNALAGTKLTLESVNPRYRLITENRYSIRNVPKKEGGTNSFISDMCNKGAEVVISNVKNLSEKVYKVSTSFSIKLTKNISRLVKGKQILDVFAENWNEKNPNKIIRVGNNTFKISATKLEKERNKLEESTYLITTGMDPKKTRLGIDSTVAEGLSELYIIDSQKNNFSGQYKRYRPQLLPDGKSKVQVPYSFNIKYKSSNIKAPEVHSDIEGKLNFKTTAEVITDTDYYIANIQFQSSCHPSEEFAIKHLSKDFNKVMGLAKATVDLLKLGQYERIVIDELGGKPNKYRTVIPWETIKKDKVKQAISYLDKCTAEILNPTAYTKKIKENKVFSYNIVHGITIYTKNYAKLINLQEELLRLTELNRSSNLVTATEISLNRLSPELLPEKHFHIVEVESYSAAIKKLTYENGEVAKKLLDEIQAKEAYYSLSIANLSTRLEPSRRSSPTRDSSMEEKQELIRVDDGNLDLYELKANQTYTVLYKPIKDLVQILQDKRREAEILKNGPSLP